MAPQVPLDTTYATCPRCGFSWLELNLSSGLSYRCAGCEWFFTFSTTAPTGSINAGIAAGAVALPVASGGASFTTGMVLLIDTGSNAEVLRVTATGSPTSIPVTAVGLAHLSATAFGKLAYAPTFSSVQNPQPASPWPTLAPSTF